MLFQRRGQGSALAGSLRRGAQGELLTGPPDTKSRQGALPASLRTSQNAQVPRFRKTGKGPPHGLCAAGGLKKGVLGFLHGRRGLTGSCEGQGPCKRVFFKAGPMPPAAFSVMTAGGVGALWRRPAFSGELVCVPRQKPEVRSFPPFCCRCSAAAPGSA